MGFLYRDFTAAITIKSKKFLSVVIQVSVFSFGWFREWLASARAFCRMETRSQNGREESQTDASIVRNDFFVFFLGGGRGYITVYLNRVFKGILIINYSDL